MKQKVFSLFIVLAFLYPGTVKALQVEAVKVGFSGCYLEKNINPVSSKIFNPSNEAYDGVIALTHGIGFRNRGGKLVKEIYLPPHENKWVHFYPYFSEMTRDFSLLWGSDFRNRELVDITDSKSQQPIYFSRTDSMIAGPAKLKSYPVDFFPPMLAALDSLKNVVLDHNPRWQKVRRKVFRDWVYKGGTLHLFHDSRGDYPEFTAELSELNTPLDSFVFGGGKVFRHPRQIQSVNKSFVEEKLLSHSELNMIINPNKKQDENSNTNFNVNNRNFGGGFNYMQAFYRELRSITRPEHNWGLIYFLSIVYLLAIFPGTLIMGRKRIDYKIIYFFILGSVGIMSITFWKVGQRGYDEKTMLNVVAVAHSLDNGRYDLKAWNSAFVTSGDYYTIQNEGEGNIFTSGINQNSIILNGAGGYLKVDIPPFTSQAYTNQAVYNTGKTILEVEDYQAGENLEELKMIIKTESGIDPDHVKAIVYYNGEMYDIKTIGIRLNLNDEGVLLKQYISQRFLDNNLHFYNYNPYGNSYTSNDVSKTYDKMREPLIFSSLEVTQDIRGVQEYSNGSLNLPPVNVLRVYLYGNPLKEFAQTGQGLNEQQGRVLYVHDYDLSEKK